MVLKMFTFHILKKTNSLFSLVQLRIEIEMKWTLVWLLVAGAFMLAASQQLDAEDENNELVARMVADDDETAEPNDTASNEDEDDDDEVNLRVVRSAPNAAEGANGGSTSGRVRNRGNKDKNNQQQSSSADRRRRGEGKGIYSFEIIRIREKKKCETF